MVPHIRQQYNAAFTEEKYQAFLLEIEKSVNHRASFKIAETPVFFPKKFKSRLLQACDDLVDVICRPDFIQKSQPAVLPEYFVAGETPHTAFLSVDFAVTVDEEGELSPQLIEIQGFPSLYGYQDVCARAYQKHFDIPSNYDYFFNGLSRDGYYEKLKNTVVGSASPENVVLIDIEPEKQNTQIDFWATSQKLGIHVCCVSDLKVEGRDVFYIDKNGQKVGVERIYNRVIFDELLKRTDLDREFLFMNEYNIKWVGHPHWFARISKHSLPLFESDFVPPSFYLSDENLPENLSEYVLKPLYSFSGQGVIINPVQSDVDAIPEEERSNYILQKKVAYAPIVETLDDPAKAEVRVMMLWEEDAPRPIALTNLVRLSKGEMVGVRYNKGRSWVGGSVGFFET